MQESLYEVRQLYLDLLKKVLGDFIYDLGDLVRTCVSPVSEEEKDGGLNEKE